MFVEGRNAARTTSFPAAAGLFAFDRLHTFLAGFVQEAVEALRRQLAGAAGRAEQIEIRLRFQRPAAERDLPLEAVAVREAAGPHRAVGRDRVGGEAGEGVAHPHAPLDE